MRSDRDESPSFRSLAGVLEAAAAIVRQLSADRHLPRLLQVFMALPRADRASVLAILEREVAEREASVAAGDGLVGPPDALSSLYVRLFDTERDTPGVTRDEMLRSTIEATALMTGFPPPLAQEMETALLVALDRLGDDEAAALARLHDDVLALLAPDAA